MQGEHVQFGLLHAPVSPQLQWGPQVQGEHVHLGLSQVLFVSLMVGGFQFGLTAGFDDRFGDEHHDKAHAEQRSVFSR